MIAKDLELSFHNAFMDARNKRHEYVTVEHLLLALLSEPSAGGVLRACHANMDELRDCLRKHIDERTPTAANDREVDTQPTHGFQRVVQIAILRVQSTEKKEVTGADILAAMFSEKDSHAVFFLRERSIERADVLRHIAHGVPITLTPWVDVEGSRRVIVLRDEATPAEFLARLLEDFLLMDQEEIADVLTELASAGKAVCGLYPLDAAEFIVKQVTSYARKHGYSLRFVTETQPDN
jgi:ATP-dependent Clp protease ATP-binding subunit ClpA